LINHTRFSLQQEETGVACQTAFIGQRLWRVARRRVAIIGLQIGERRTRALQRVVAAADEFGSALEAAFDARIGALQAAPPPSPLKPGGPPSASTRRIKWTRLVHPPPLPPVQSGHVSSIPPY
jgi:hypothetical protein